MKNKVLEDDENEARQTNPRPRGCITNFQRIGKPTVLDSSLHFEAREPEQYSG